MKPHACKGDCKKDFADKTKKEDHGHKHHHHANDECPHKKAEKKADGGKCAPKKDGCKPC